MSAVAVQQAPATAQDNEGSQNQSPFVELGGDNAPMTASTDSEPALESGLIPVEEPYSTLESAAPDLSKSPLSPAPPYAETNDPPMTPVTAAIAASTSSAGTTGPFIPTAHLQVQTEGKGWMSAPLLRLHPDPIPVYAVDKNATGWMGDLKPKYQSLRNTRQSDNTVLVSGENTDGAVLASVFFGFGKPPQMRVYSQHPSRVKSPYTVFREMDLELRDKAKYPISSPMAEEQVKAEDGSDRMVKSGTWTSKLDGVSWASRGVRFATPFGIFEWRYAERAERKDWDAESLIVLEKITTSLPLGAAAGGASSLDVPGCDASIKTSSSGSTFTSKDSAEKKRKKTRENRTRIGAFVRNDAFRTPGSRSHTAGNGGRLMLDLRYWLEATPTHSLDEKPPVCPSPQEIAQEIEKFAVMSVISLLHKEVERRRIHQAIII